VLSWNTELHEFRMGQWLKGRIYERRCDLSPSGQKLIYFAANYRAPHLTWSAISRPPYLTALAMWPKGDAWGGGGLFKDENTVSLNHPGGATRPEGSLLPKKMVVEPFGKHPGAGEDDPLWSTRLLRDGWILKDAGTYKINKFGSPIGYEFPKPKVWTKTRGPWTLSMRLLGMNEREGPWYILEHHISNNGKAVRSLGRTDWADWSLSGEILFAQQGRLYRIRMDGRTGPSEPDQLIDLRELRFEAVGAPPEALKWGGEEIRAKVIR
jgi:hypothetical protein